MAEQSTSVGIARAFTGAWTSKNWEQVAEFVAEDVVFDGPMGHVEGRTAYIESLKGLIGFMGVTGAQIVAVYGDDSQALIMYELNTTKFGPLLCAKLLTFQAGRIARDRLTFDSYPVRKA